MYSDNIVGNSSNTAAIGSGNLQTVAHVLPWRLRQTAAAFGLMVETGQQL